jgi:hypothetical protein
MDTVSVTDFEMKSPTLAKVIVSFTGRYNKESIRTALLEKLANLAAPVDNSFRLIKAGVAVGFLRANKEVRVIEPNELRANYRVMSSNIMMDNSDKSLWAVKEGKSGKYLARHGNEDLSELINASINRRQDVPGLRHLSMAKAAAGEFVAFISKTGDMDYGFAVRANAEKVQVISHATHTPVVIDYSLVASISPVPVPREFAKQMKTAGISRADKQQANEYWRKLYSYDPAYMQDTIDQVNEDVVA